MASKLEILGQVMMSFKSDQNKVMNDINAMLNNRDKEVDLIDRLKEKVSELAEIHLSMQETQGFILQLTSKDLKDKGCDIEANEDSEKNEKTTDE